MRLEMAAIECGPAMANTRDKDSHQQAWRLFNEKLNAVQVLWSELREEARKYPSFTFGDIHGFNQALNDWMADLTQVAMQADARQAHTAAGLHRSAHRLVAAANEFEKSLEAARAARTVEPAVSANELRTVDSPELVHIFSRLARHWRAMIERLEDKGELTEAEDEAQWNHPIEHLFRRIEEMTGISRNNLADAAWRINTPMGLGAWKRQTKQISYPDLLWILPKLKDLDRDGSTLRLLAELWNLDSEVATEAKLPKMIDTTRREGPKGGDQPDDAPLAGTTKSGAKLPNLGPHDRQAYQLSLLHGWTQQRIADELNKQHGKTYTQGQVSRMIARAKQHAEASGLTDMIPDAAKPAKAVDPHRLEIGRRTDPHTPSQRKKANPDDD